MGAWGAGVFENDDACDFAAAVAEQKNLAMLETTLDEILAFGSDYLEAPEGSAGLAAADIVARLQGRWGQRDAYTAEIDRWVERIGLQPSAVLIGKAQQTVTRVMTEPSELLELWNEGDPSEFTAAVDDLTKRLR